MPELYVTPEQVKYVYDKLQRQIDALADVTTVDSWEDVQKAVRSGIAGKIFAIGDQLTCQRDGVNLVWDVIGIDHDTPADPQFTHSLTLQLHDCFANTMQFDAPEAFYYAKNGLSAGTYYFSIDSSYGGAYNDFGAYRFTLTQAVPAGGQLTFPWGSNVNASTIKVCSFAEPASTVPIEQVSVAQGTGGTNLGTLTVAGDWEHNLNSIHRVRYGNNNYKESAIRQWLGSSAAAGSFVWTAQNNFDRPPAWDTDNNTAGFMNGMDADFLAVLGNVTKTTAKNDNGSYTTDDTFFLLSKSEVYGGVEVSGVDEGEPYPYYSNYSGLAAAGTGNDGNRIKCINGTAQYWWTRTPNSGNGYYVNRVNATGSVSNYSAYYGIGIAPACNII